MKALQGIRILSLALNLPGPAALMRCRAMGATCVKVEPPAGDPMRHYGVPVYEALHAGVEILQADLKTEAGQAVLAQQLAQATILLTSFRPAALNRLGLAWPDLQARHPQVSQVAIVGASGPQAEVPGHDLTYLAQSGLVQGTAMPATLYADMAGSLLAVEAILQAALLARSAEGAPQGRYLEVGLSDASDYLALPRRWGLTTPGGAVGGAHAGYRVYPCRNGRVAVAALEPHFARRLCKLAGVADHERQMTAPSTHAALEKFFADMDGIQVSAMAAAHALPLHVMDDEAGSA